MIKILGMRSNLYRNPDAGYDSSTSSSSNCSEVLAIMAPTGWVSQVPANMMHIWSTPVPSWASGPILLGMPYISCTREFIFFGLTRWPSGGASILATRYNLPVLLLIFCSSSLLVSILPSRQGKSLRLWKWNESFFPSSLFFLEREVLIRCENWLDPGDHIWDTGNNHGAGSAVIYACS